MASAMLVLWIVACGGGPTSPSGGGGHSGGGLPVIGHFCSPSQRSSVSHNGDVATVTAFWNISRFVDVAGSDGIVRRQEHRDCGQGTCVFRGVSGLDDSQLISECINRIR